MDGFAIGGRRIFNISPPRGERLSFSVEAIGGCSCFIGFAVEESFFATTVAPFAATAVLIQSDAYALYARASVCCYLKPLSALR